MQNDAMKRAGRTITQSASLALLFGLGLALSGCPDKGDAPTAEPAAAGCAKDTDCKGDRVCQNGACVAAAGGEAATAKPTAPAAENGALASDGLPASIPAPGSKPPTTEEWNAVTREVTVRGSTARNCETKMVREWLRVSCRTKGDSVPKSVATKQSGGQQAYVFNAEGLASVVVQVAPAKEYKATFTWANAGSPAEADLVVSWPGGAPRPALYFDR